ncbi:MAG TPA: hypothetical protein VF268_01500 [Gammaproteobacteria bacterium]
MAVEKSAITDLAVISWGSVIAGLFFVIAASWLLFLLGSGIGVSIADASDLEAMGSGLGWGAIIWIILTELVVFFVGGVLAARLAGRLNDMEGLLHGLTLWSAGTVLMLLLGSWGVSNAFQAGQSLLGGAATLGKAVAQGAGAASPNLEGVADSQLMNEIQTMIKREAAQAASQVAESGGQAGAVSPQEARQAIEQLDQNTLQSIARQLVMGNTEGARNALVANTNLSEQEINALLDGISQQVNQRMEQAKLELSKTMERVSSYTQGVIWTLFVSSLLALIAALIGGSLGAKAV